MAASNEIRFRIGGDTSALSRSFAEAQSLADKAGKSMAKSFDLKNGMRGMVVALGISIENIATKVSEIFTGGSRDSWQAALDAAKETARVMEDSMMKRMSMLRQIQSLEQQLISVKADQNPTPKKPTGFFGNLLTKPGLFNGPLGQVIKKIAGVETEADAAKRVNEAKLKGAVIEERITSTKEDQGKMEERIAASRRELSLMGASDAEKWNAAMEDAEALQEKINRTKSKGEETGELELQRLQKLKAAREIALGMDRERTREMEKHSDLQKKQTDELLEGMQKVREASAKIDDAEAGLKDAKHNAMAFSLNDAAGGQRGTASDSVAARKILADEKMAQRLFDSGNTVTQWDPKLGKNVQRGADFFQNRAEQARGKFGKLTTADQNPFAAQVKELKDANKSLKGILASLKPVAPNKELDDYGN